MDLKKAQTEHVDVDCEVVGGLFKVTVRHWPSGEWLQLGGDAEDEEWLVKVAKQALKEKVLEEVD